MKVLFIGGTGIISAAVSQRVVDKGMELTLLNRGKRGDFLPPGASHIAADVRDRGFWTALPLRRGPRCTTYSFTAWRRA